MGIKDFVNKIVKEYGENIYVSLEDDLVFDVVPTSSLGLNLATKVGGIPLKAIIEIFGKEGSGKSTLSLDVSKNYLDSQEDRGVLYVDVENMMSPDYVKSILGEDDRFVLVKPITSEDALTVAEDGIESGNFGIVIVDSVGALAPRREVESDLDKDSYSGSAKLLARFLRRVSPKVNHNNVSLIMVNQVRDNVGSYIGGYSTPGGHSLKHYASLRIMLSDVQKIKEKDTVIGNYVKYTIKKNKLGSPFATGEFPLIFGVGIDKILDVIETASKLGIIIRKGSYYYFDGEQLGQGVHAVREKLASDAETLDKIIDLCYTSQNIRGKEE